MSPLDALPQDAPSAALGSDPPPKRRKLRKGTQSCWECKRRKARCIFSAATPNACDACKHRGTDCIGQEVAEKPPPPGSNKQLVDRLGHVEALLDQILKSQGEHQHGTERAGLSRIQKRGRSRSSSPTRSPSIVNDGATPQSRTTTTDDSIPPRSASYSDPSRLSSESKHQLSDDLRKAWPSPKDLDALLSVPVEASQIIRAVTCVHVNANKTNIPSSRDLIQLPTPEAHPTLVARSLLILATFMQGIPATSIKRLRAGGTDCAALMSEAVKKAHSLVTCNDDLVASIEGIECIMLESLYENYGGNLRRSWLAARRALMIAQMIGLDQGTDVCSLEGTSVNPGETWFRLVQLDRYLSLMLGLPQTTVPDSYVSPEVLMQSSALDRLQRLCCFAGGRLLQRDNSTLYDGQLTREVDKILHDASSAMPAQYWSHPTLSTCTSQQETICETLRFNAHFMYYHTLLQLHFPYLLRPGPSNGYNYHFTTAVTASREILIRFNSFRELHSASYYCRGVDLIAFISSTALCLANIIERSRQNGEGDDMYFRQHQRLADQGLLERVLDFMDKILEFDHDHIAAKTAKSLRCLLNIEGHVASGTRYNVRFGTEPRRDSDLGLHVDECDGNGPWKIHLPHLPVIHVEVAQSQISVDTAGIATNIDAILNGSGINEANTQSPSGLLGVSARHQQGGISSDGDRLTIFGPNLILDSWAWEGLDIGSQDGLHYPG